MHTVSSDKEFLIDNDMHLVADKVDKDFKKVYKD